MKRILFVSIALILAINLNAQQTGYLTDNRDGKTYKTVKIGDQIWMAENLAYKPKSGNYWAHYNKSSNVKIYGYLYDWETANNVCPRGWHLPSDSEWTQLTNFVGNNPGVKLKAKTDWHGKAKGTDNYGFSALPGGSRNLIEKYVGFRNKAGWWTSTQIYAGTAYNRIMEGNASYIERGLTYSKDWGFSVRCVKD